ncbi:DUF4345 domain-containing protein [Thalassotalea euphylliae]|uniref:DUF4345 domain-containing protein n=1 Tax=Thalassotalea euphylliae TaxID=1655234 RepID=A0A3E0TUA6_9GAMM|nr:DUF4345 domain-containing protein [Thalassotalea euphylliae]REL27542.1 DUF4345 domain-containing protein [Thalassotalea euphylliae]
MAKLLIYATAGFFLLYGLAFAFYPISMAMWVTDASPSSTSAVIDFRATYGGAQVAIGLLLLLIVKVRNDIDLALTMVALLLLSMALGRFIGIVIDGEPNLIMYVYLAAELAFGVLALWLKLRLKVE